MSEERGISSAGQLVVANHVTNALEAQRALRPATLAIAACFDQAFPDKSFYEIVGATERQVAGVIADLKGISPEKIVTLITSREIGMPVISDAAAIYERAVQINQPIEVAIKTTRLFTTYFTPQHS